MTTLRRWYCPRCGYETSSPMFKYYPDDGYVGTPRYGCPRCGEWDIEELEPCPECDGWMHRDETICEKCQLRAKGAMQRFFRQHGMAAREWMENYLIEDGIEGLL